MRDQLDDKNNAELMQLNHDLVIPNFVKEASVLTHHDEESNAPGNFADIHNKKFPICSKADTWLSAAYFQKNASQDAHVGARLREACALWDVDWDSCSPKQYKEASAPTPTGVIKYEDGETCHQSLPYYSGADLAKVASDILDNSEKYTYAIRRSVARQLLSKEASFTPSQTVVSQLQKCAGYGVGTLKALTFAVAKRSAALPKNNYDDVRDALSGFVKTASESALNGYVGPEVLEKAAGLLDTVDVLHNLRKKASIDAPEQEIFGISLAEADRYNAGMIKLANGRILNGGKLGYRDMADFLSAAFGKEATSKEDVRESMENLTGPQSDLLCRYVEKTAMEEEMLPDPTDEYLLPETQEDLESGEKPGGEDGLLNWIEDDS